jgi:hypothetical protein
VKLDKIKRSSTYSVIKREGPNMLRLLEFPGIGTGRVMKVDGDNSTEHLAERIARVEFVNDNAEVGDAEGGDAVKASVYMGNNLKKKNKAAKLAAKVEEQEKKKAENEKTKFLLVEREKARADLLEEQKRRRDATLLRCSQKGCELHGVEAAILRHTRTGLHWRQDAGDLQPADRRTFRPHEGGGGDEAGQQSPRRASIGVHVGGRPGAERGADGDA